MRQYKKIPLPFECGSTYSLTRDPDLKFTIRRIQMFAKPELGISFFFGKYEGDEHDSMLNGNELIPEFANVRDVPDDFEWKFCYEKGEKRILKWDSGNEVWWDRDQNCYIHSNVRWIND